jgi:hypothetical protein
MSLIAVILAFVIVLLILGYDVAATDPSGSLAFAPSPAFLLRKQKLKGTVSGDFRHQVFFH